MQKSIFSILYSKFLRYLDETSFFNLFTSFAKVASWLLISLLLVNMPDSQEKLTMLVKWHDFAAIKILTSFILVFHIRSIISLWRKILQRIRDDLAWVFQRFEEAQPMYQGIPVSELVDYLFLESAYSRDDFCQRFAVARRVFDDMADAFDTQWIFKRGRNNARILNTEYSRSDIASVLQRASESGEIRPLMRKTESGYSHRPTWFTTRPLHDSSPLPV